MALESLSQTFNFCLFCETVREMEPHRHRRHAFAGPPNCYQVVSWLFMFVLCSLFYSLLLPSCSHVLFQSALPGFSICFLTALMGYLKCSLTDPSDAGLLYRLNPTATHPPLTFTHFCLKCQANVQSTSKHCRICNRCTENFDHHCVWVNNCIGGRNYRPFVVLIVSVEGMMLMELVTAGFLLFEVFSEGAKGSEIVKRFDIGEHGVCFITTVLAVAVFCLFFSFTIGILIIFHVVLRIRRLSTFEYILRKSRQTAKVHVYAAPALRDSGIVEAQEHSSVLQERKEDMPLQLAHTSKTEISSHTREVATVMSA